MEGLLEAFLEGEQGRWAGGREERAALKRGEELHEAAMRRGVSPAGAMGHRLGGGIQAGGGGVGDEGGEGLQPHGRGEVGVKDESWPGRMACEGNANKERGMRRRR